VVEPAAVEPPSLLVSLAYLFFKTLDRETERLLSLRGTRMQFACYRELTTGVDLVLIPQFTPGIVGRSSQLHRERKEFRKRLEFIPVGETRFGTGSLRFTQLPIPSEVITFV
jgi:hypothetical protein